MFVHIIGVQPVVIAGTVSWRQVSQGRRRFGLTSSSKQPETEEITVAVDERTRLRIRQWFMQQIDDEEMADAIMESMPPVEWSELVTKQDLALTTRELRSEMGEIRVEMGEMRVELKTEMGDLRSDLKSDIAKISYDLASFQRTMMFMLIGFALTIWISLLVA